MTLRRRSALLAVAVLAGAAAGGAYLLLADERYEAVARLQVVPLLPGDRTFAGFALARGSRGSSTAAETVADLVETPSVLGAAAVRLRLDRDDVLEAVSVETVGASNVVRIRARSRESQRAAQLANAVATAFVAERSALFQAELNRTITELREQLRGIPASRRDDPPASALVRRLATLRTYLGQRDPTVRVAAEATARDEVVWPRPLPVLATTIGAGLLLGLAAGAISERRRPAPRAVVHSGEDDAALARRERELEQRTSSVTARELAVARAAAVLELRERELERAAASAAKREREAAAEARRVERSRAELEAREAGASAREREVQERLRAAEDLARRPERAATPGVPGAWNVLTLARLVEDHGEAHPDRLDEWNTYLYSLRGHAEADGSLPPSFDALVEEVFGELLGCPAAERRPRRPR